MQTHVSTIERNLEVTNIWLKELSEELQDVDKDEAWTRLGAVMQTIRDRLPVDDAANLAAQLPELIRGVYFGSWDPSKTPQKWRQREDYLNAVNDKLGPRDPIDAEETIRAVLRVAAKHLNERSLQKIKEAHPKEVWDLWPV